MGKALKSRFQQAAFPSRPEELILGLLAVYEHVRDRFQDLFREHRLTPGQYNVLRILRGAGSSGHARCSIAQRMIDRSPDVTRILDRLVKAGHVKRSAGSLDRRTSIARITPSGLALLRKLDGPVSALHATLAAPLSAADQSKLVLLLEKMHAAIPAAEVDS